MLLTEEGVLNYLLYRGLINGDEAISEKTIVQKKFSRNRNFSVTLENGIGYFLKQVSTSSSEKQQTLRSEANCYWLANNDINFSVLNPVLCKYYDYNPAHHILIIESLNSSTNVFEYIQYHKIISPEISVSMGNALSVLHQITSSLIEDSKAGKLFSKFIPWIFKIDNSSQTFFNITTPATKQVFDIVKEHSNYVELINHCKEQWEIKSLIHGDVKFPNFLITNKDAGNLKIIDFEICDIGDPCWDVAGVLQAYLTWWIDFASADNMVLKNLEPSIKKFWSSYADGVTSISKDEKELLKKCMQYTAVRMIQTTYEMATSQNELHQNQIKTLQMSLNILLKPSEASFDLFGIN